MRFSLFFVMLVSVVAAGCKLKNPRSEAKGDKPKEWGLPSKECVYRGEVEMFESEMSFLGFSKSTGRSFYINFEAKTSGNDITLWLYSEEKCSEFSGKIDRHGVFDKSKVDGKKVDSPLKPRFDGSFVDFRWHKGNHLSVVLHDKEHPKRGDVSLKGFCSSKSVKKTDQTSKVDDPCEKFLRNDDNVWEMQTADGSWTSKPQE